VSITFFFHTISERRPFFEFSGPPPPPLPDPVSPGTPLLHIPAASVACPNFFAFVRPVGAHVPVSGLWLCAAKLDFAPCNFFQRPASLLVYSGPDPVDGRPLPSECLRTARPVISGPCPRPTLFCLTKGQRTFPPRSDNEQLPPPAFAPVNRSLYSFSSFFFLGVFCCETFSDLSLVLVLNLPRASVVMVPCLPLKRFPMHATSTRPPFFPTEI